VALQGVAHELAHRQGQVAVRAAVFERDRRAVLEPIKHDRLAQDHAAKGLARDLVVLRGDVPIIPEEHGFPPCALAELVSPTWYSPEPAFSNAN
jgi:hypothetical protein